jgi:hypothetical protein
MKAGFPALLLRLFEFGRAAPFGFSPRDECTFGNALEGSGWPKGRMPRLSRSEQRQGARQAAEQIGIRTGCCEGEAHAACGFDDAGGDFDQPQAQSWE